MTTAQKLLGERLLPWLEAIEEVIEEVTGTRRTVQRRTASNWVKVGVRGALLETIKIGNRRYTSREAVLRFLAASQGEPA